jgi:hypothetical protein
MTVSWMGRVERMGEMINAYKIRVIRPRKMRWAGHVARIGEKRNAYKELVGKPEGNRPLERRRRR